MPALTTVDLSYNRLTDVHAEDMSGVQSLETVDLRGKPLTQAVKTLLLSMVRVRVVLEEEKEENERNDKERVNDFKPIVNHHTVVG